MDNNDNTNADVLADFTIDPSETTSPSQLQEVTLDPDGSYAYSVGIRSPNGPMRGRSVKEYEEQVTTLRKENFNLKLRIYFLEERMGTNFNLDQENAVKKNIELMVEVESLRKELQEKQDLLCQAVKAMELEEEEHRKDSEAKEKELNDLKQQYAQMEQQYEVMQDEVRSHGDHISLDTDQQDYYIRMQENSQEMIREMERKVDVLEKQLRCERGTVEKLNNLLKMSDMSSEVKAVNTALADKEEKLEDLLVELDEKNQVISDTNMRLQTVELQLQERKKELEYLQHEVRQKSAETIELKVLYEEMKNLYEHEFKKNKEHKVAIANRNTKIVDLENSVDRYKVKMANLELKLQTAQNEVKSKPNETPRSPQRDRSAGGTDTDSFSVRGSTSSAERSPKSLSRVNGSSRQSLNSSKGSTTPTDVDEPSSQHVHLELANTKKVVVKLEQEQLKACRIIQTMLESRKKHTREIEELQQNLHKRDAEIAELRQKLGGLEAKDRKSLKTQISELKLTAAAPATDSEHSVVEAEDSTGQLLEQYKRLTDELDTQKQILLDTLKEKDAQMQALEERYNEVLKELKSKDNRIVDLEFELLNGRDEAGGVKEKSDAGTEKASFWIRESEEKDREIERLEKELTKRTCDLQSVVNKELWEKNREIEKLQERNREIEKLERRFSEVCDKKDVEISELKKDIINRDKQLKGLKDRMFEVETKESSVKTSTMTNIKSLQEKLKYCLEDRKRLVVEIEELKDKVATLSEEESRQLKDVRAELEKSEALRTETNDVCAVLNVRLEELAQFLDSLLSQKSVLGFLGQRQTARLRHFVDQSLDLSRTLSLTLNINPDESLLQLSNISELLNSTRNETLNLDEFFGAEKESSSRLSIMPDHVTLTYQSHLNVRNRDKSEEQEQIIKVLRDQVENLKREIELRDNELAGKLSIAGDKDEDSTPSSKRSSKLISPDKILESLLSDKIKVNLFCDKDKSSLLNTSTTLKYQDNSDSESWSEPDRSVSKARIGLRDESLKPNLKNVSVQSESTEMELNKSLSRLSMKRTMAENRQTISLLSVQVSELEEKLRGKESELASLESVLKQERSRLQGQEEMVRKIERLEGELVEAVERKAAAEKRVQELQEVVEELRQSKEALAETADSKSKAVQNRINELEYEKGQAQYAAKVAEEQLRVAREQISFSEERLESAEREMAALKASAKRELAAKLEEVEKLHEDKIQELKVLTNAEMEKMTEAANKMKLKYEQEYVKRSEMENLALMIRDLESLRDVLRVSEEKVRRLETNESELKKNFADTEEMYRTKLTELRSDLDTATLQYSEAVLDKTHMEEEKARLESETKRFREREKDFEHQVAELKDEFESLKEKFQRQVAGLEGQKSKLQVRISELESSNADLRNRLIRMQTGRDAEQALSAPTSPQSRILEMYFSKNREPYRRQTSESSGGYVSETYVQFRQGGNDENIGVNNLEMERMQANSSPDLGIESDHGRFSSLEANVNVPRPYLQSLEVSQSINQSLDKDQSQLVTCRNEQCCTKTKELQTENTTLRKKLVQSNKLLEETVLQLAKANQRKREVERSICQQIHKTSQVLRKVKANLDSGSESDLLRK